jgi:hypothetical protein
MNEDFAILLFFFGVSLTANVGLAFAWFRASRRARRLESQPLDLTRLDDLVARVEQGVDTVNGRVEELASGQEFMNRVLSDRLDRLGRALPALPSRAAPPGDR